MASIVDRLPASAIPFVTRSLRRGRGRRYAALSFGLALLVLLISLWIGLGRGETARDTRIDLGMEPAIHTLEFREFVLVRDDFDTDLSLAHEQARVAEDAQLMVLGALEQAPDTESQLELRDRARTLATSWGPASRSDHYFSWHDPSQVHRLGKIVERGGVPAIVDYTPVVDLRGTLNLLAMLTGGLSILLLTVVAPLLVALQQASERHENTLQPLTGTALDARQLMVGLACGPLAVVAIFAAPLAALFALAAMAVGELESLILLPALIGTAIGLVFGAQLLAHLLGARRAPGLIAVGLLCLLGFVGLSGIGAAAELDRNILGMPAVLPHSGLFALLGDGFGDCWRQAALASGHVPSRAAPLFGEFLAPTMIGALGAALLGFLALRALTRHVEGQETLLGWAHALFGALICIAMINVAIPTIADARQPLHQAFGLPALAVPFLLLMMARVPIGDLPTKLRRIPLARLIGEFAGWVLLQMIVAAVLDRTTWGFHPLAMLGIGWCVVVMVLLAIRLAATPGRILGHVWAAVCLIMLPFTYGLASVWAFEPNAPMTIDGDTAELLIAWMIMLALVPITLIRHLRKHAAQFT